MTSSVKFSSHFKDNLLESGIFPYKLMQLSGSRHLFLVSYLPHLSVNAVCTIKGKRIPRNIQSS